MATWQNSKGTGRSSQPIGTQLLRTWWQIWLWETGMVKDGKTKVKLCNIFFEDWLNADLHDGSLVLSKTLITSSPSMLQQSCMTYLSSIYTSSWLTGWRGFELFVSQAHQSTKENREAHYYERTTVEKGNPLYTGPAKALTYAARFLSASTFCCIRWRPSVPVRGERERASWCVEAEVMLDRLNVRIIHCNQLEEACVRATDLTIETNLANSLVDQFRNMTTERRENPCFLWLIL